MGLSEKYERATWSSKTELLLSLLGYCVGLGNVWRFPYLTFDTGGGAFLIPYLIMLLFTGLPMMFLEMAFGQYASQGVITVWKAVPLLRGIGYGMLLATGIGNISFMLVIAYILFYLFASFRRTLPWIGCDNEWNTVLCSELLSDCISKSSIIAANGSCVNPEYMTSQELLSYGVAVTPSGEYNFSNYVDPFDGERVRPTEEYWNIRVRHEASSINNTGGIVWEVALCLLLAWVLVFLCLIKGIKTSGKVVYVTAIFPYIMLFIFLVLGLTLPGHTNGIKFFITPRWEYLAKPKSWLNAAIQIFYSLGASWGGVITLSSFNTFRNNIYIDSMTISIANSLTSLFAGFVIFSFLGFIGHELNRDVSKVVSQGYGLAFIVYPEAISLLPVPTLWAVLFFLMLLSLALDTHFASTEAVITAVVDLMPVRWKQYKILVLISYCCVGYLLGLICTTEAGPYWANLIDQSSASFAILLFALLECVAISWIYGYRRFKNDIRSMIGDKWVDHPTFWAWLFQWRFGTPLMMALILLFNFANWSDPTYNGPYPFWARVIGWLISCSTLMWLPLFIIYHLASTPGTLFERLRLSISPEDNWGPIREAEREHAWSVHMSHGTTMGGKKKLTYAIDSNIELPQNPLSQDPKTLRTNQITAP